MRTNLAVGGLAAALALAGRPAAAHSYLQSSTPAGGSTLEKTPTEVSITFTEALEPRFSKIEVKDATGHSVVSGDMHAVGDGATVMAVPVKELAPGKYKVIWHVTSTDTHKTQGTFAFEVIAPD